MPMKQYESRGYMPQNCGKIHVKANIGVSRMKSRTLAKFQQCVRTIESYFIVHF